jgi:hypothetical protein
MDVAVSVVFRFWAFDLGGWTMSAQLRQGVEPVRRGINSFDLLFIFKLYLVNLTQVNIALGKSALLMSAGVAHI